jgi:hypothetical protein
MRSLMTTRLRHELGAHESFADRTAGARASRAEGVIIMTFTPAITLTAALNDPNLFGKVFANPTYWTWKVVAKLIDGVPLTEQREIDLRSRPC